MGDPREPRAGTTGLDRELGRLRSELHRYQLYLVVAFAAVGVGTLVSIGLVTFYGFRLAERLAESEERVVRLREETQDSSDELYQALLRQQGELAAIRKAADEDLRAIREAHRKLAAARDPREELSALREANEALWAELAQQRSELLDALKEAEHTTDVAASNRGTRFRLGETMFVESGEKAGAIRGFIEGGEKIYRATSRPGNPGYLLIELEPEEVGLGEPYQLSVRLVNRSNRRLSTTGLRLDWSFAGKNTGGNVPLSVEQVGARESAVLYRLYGRWTPAHEEGSVSVTATLVLDDGGRLSNTLHW